MKNFAVYSNGNSEYMKDSHGNVYKFICGKDDTTTKNNYLRLVGSVSPCLLPDDFDSIFYDGFAPVVGEVHRVNNNLFVWEC